jgi:hypothetical protein
VADMYLAKASRNGRVGLVPTDQEAVDALCKMGDGECALFKMVRPRSLPWHRKYFAICGEIGKNQDPPRDKDSIDYELRVLGGHYEVMYARKGNELYEVRTPKRLAFDKLTAEQWEAVYPSLELAGRERFGNEYWDNNTW